MRLWMRDVNNAQALTRNAEVEPGKDTRGPGLPLPPPTHTPSGQTTSRKEELLTCDVDLTARNLESKDNEASVQSAHVQMSERKWPT